MKDLKEKIVLGILLTVILTAFIRVCYSSAAYNEYVQGDRIVLNRNEIQKISVTGTGGCDFMGIDITDDELIRSFADYLTSLKVDSTKMYANEYPGDSYEVIIRLKDNSAGCFIIGGGGILSELMEIEERSRLKAGETCIEGTVVYMDIDWLGNCVSCTVRDKNNIDHEVIVNTKHIINITESGGTYIGLNQQIKVFSSTKSDSNSQEPFIASTVYIHHSAAEKMQS